MGLTIKMVVNLQFVERNNLLGVGEGEWLGEMGLYIYIYIYIYKTN